MGWRINKNKASKKTYSTGDQKIDIQATKKNWNPWFSMALATVWKRNRTFLWYLQRFGSGTSRWWQWNSPLILGKFLLLESSNCFLRTLFLVLAQIESLNTSWFIDWCPLNVGKITWFWFNQVNPPFTAESFYLGLGFHQFDCHYYFKFMLTGAKPYV